MTTQPSDWAVARAFWEASDKLFATKEDERFFPILLAISERARELDASAKCDCGCGRSVCPACGEDLGFATPRSAEAATTNSAQISSSLVVGDALDAARYRWLKSQNTLTENPGAWTITRCDFTDAEGPSRYWVGVDLDAAIDAAMGAVGAGGGE